MLGTLPALAENKHTENLLKYFSALFRDTKDDAFGITLKAHKTVMGQLEKGELSLDSNWQAWDEVRRHSVLSQTLSNLTNLSTKLGNNQNSNGAGKSKAANSSQNQGQSSTANQNKNSGDSAKPFYKPCTYYNIKKCRQGSDHGDKYHEDKIWLHICPFCMKTRNDRARHSEPDCPFKERDGSKNGDGPLRGQ